ncbi:MAG TPA: hypothetical protein PLN61_00175 [bacterium]|nr:hypothetical protein [bacterium]HQI47056.1 hypothetical protein [bacterium]HQJ65387.1 hypothetical protein [bacterium]
MVLYPLSTLAQTSEPIETTQSLLENLARQVDQNIEEIKFLRADTAGAPESIGQMMESIAREFPQPQAREVGESTSFPLYEVGFSIISGQFYQVKDREGRLGLVLSDRLAQDYAKKIELIPAYEKALAGYRSQADLHKQLVTQYEFAMEIKDKRIAALNEMGTLLSDNAELYKKISEIRRGSLWEKILQKLAFPAGLAFGIAVGANLPGK